jgi:hypothetical protein
LRGADNEKNAVHFRRLLAPLSPAVITSSCRISSARNRHASDSLKHQIIGWPPKYQSVHADDRCTVWRRRPRHQCCTVPYPCGRQVVAGCRQGVSGLGRRNSLHMETGDVGFSGPICVRYFDLSHTGACDVPSVMPDAFVFVANSKEIRRASAAGRTMSGSSGGGPLTVSF